MLIKRACRYIAKKVIDNIDHDVTNLDENSLYKRLSILTIHTLLAIIVISVGLYFGILWHLLVVVASVALLRILNGGNHFRSPDMCFVVTTSAILLNPLLQHWLAGYEVYIFVICLVVYAIFSPYREHNKKQYWLRKSIVVIGLIFAYIASKDILYTYAILLPDLIYRNPIWSKIKRRK